MLGSIGTISHATLRNEDLIPAFVDELKRLDDAGFYKGLVKEANKIMKRVEDADWLEDSGWLVERLFDALATFAPVGCVFGANEGDGSDFGFWPIDNDGYGD